MVVWYVCDVCKRFNLENKKSCNISAAPIMKTFDSAFKVLSNSVIAKTQTDFVILVDVKLSKFK